MMPDRRSFLKVACAAALTALAAVYAPAVSRCADLSHGDEWRMVAKYTDGSWTYAAYEHLSGAMRFVPWQSDGNRDTANV